MHGYVVCVRTTWTLPLCVTERFASVDVMLGSISAWTFLGYAPVLYLCCSHGSSALRLFSQKSPLVQRKTESEQERVRDKRSRGRKRKGVTLLLMVWNHKCKSALTSAPLPLPAKRPTAAADAGLSLAVINNTMQITNLVPFPALPFLAYSVQKTDNPFRYLHFNSLCALKYIISIVAKKKSTWAARCSTVTAFSFWLFKAQCVISAAIGLVIKNKTKSVVKHFVKQGVIS